MRIRGDRDEAFQQTYDDCCGRANRVGATDSLRWGRRRFSDAIANRNNHSHADADPHSHIGKPVLDSGCVRTAHRVRAEMRKPHVLASTLRVTPLSMCRVNCCMSCFGCDPGPNKTYLWNNEVTDQDPAGFSDRVDYFDVLRTFETTASGADKDQFHFSQPTEDFLEQRNAAPTSGYGVEFAVFEPRPPRDVRVLFTDPDTPASTPVNGQVPFVRGSKILEIDGVDMINGDDVDTLNAGLFPALAGETHTFKVQDPDGSEHTIDITSADIPVKPVNRTAILDTSSGKAGYILFNTFSPFSSEKAIATARSPT